MLPRAALDATPAYLLSPTHFGCPATALASDDSGSSPSDGTAPPSWVSLAASRAQRRGSPRATCPSTRVRPPPHPCHCG